jgi:hypothetical protein
VEGVVMDSLVAVAIYVFPSTDATDAQEASVLVVYSSQIPATFPVGGVTLKNTVAEVSEGVTLGLVRMVGVTASCKIVAGIVIFGPTVISDLLVPVDTIYGDDNGAPYLSVISSYAILYSLYIKSSWL